MSQEMNRMERAKVYRGPEAVTRLHDLDSGLEVSDFLEGFRFGVAEGHQSTPFEPMTSSGWIRWAKTVGSFRETVEQKGWRMVNEGNYALAVNPAGGVAIVVASGDENTGLDHPDIPEPQCKNPKGTFLEGAVEHNYRQLQFADAHPNFKRFPEPKRPTWVTWVFLCYEDHLSGETRSELSLPTEMSAKNITRWRERIILEGTDSPETNKVPTADEEVPIEVPVERRVG